MTNESETNSTPEIEAARTKKPRRFRVWPIIALIILALPVYGLRKYAQTLLKTSVNPQNMPALRADCGVVLTGAAGRIREGISLLSHNQIQKLIISGVHQRSTLNDMFPELLFYPEIKLENVILERRSSSTAGNAQTSLPIVEALHCQSVLLITHDYHMYRAFKTFKQLYPGAIQIIPYSLPSDRLHLRTQAFFDYRFWETVFEEWCKYLFYEVFVFGD